MPFNHYCAVQAAMVGFFMAYFIDSLTSVGLVDQMENFFCKTLLFVAIAGVLLRRKNEDVDNLKKLLDETTFYDNHEKKEVWRGKWGPLVVESGEGGGWEEEYAFYLEADDVYQRMCVGFNWNHPKTLTKHPLLIFLPGMIFWGVVSSVLWQKILLMRSMAKCGRMVESENHPPRQPPQAHPGYELVKAQRKRSKHEELNLCKKSKDKKGNYEISDGAIDKKSKNLLSKSAYKEMADLQEELRVVKNDSFAPKVTSEGNTWYLFIERCIRTMYRTGFPNVVLTNGDALP
ncbi:hypothetical protein Tco_0659319 [Tanacetum coccineum]